MTATSPAAPAPAVPAPVEAVPAPVEAVPAPVEAVPAEEPTSTTTPVVASAVSPTDVLTVEPASPGTDVTSAVEPSDTTGPAEPETDEQAAPGVPGGGTPARDRSGLVLKVLAGAAALAALAVAAFGAYSVLAATPAERRDTARDEALRTARDAARLLLAYDYRRLEEDFAAGLALTADPFRSEYERTTTKLVTDVAVQYKAVVRSEVVQAGAVEVTEDRVVALVFVNQTTTSTRVQGAKVDLSRVRMVLEKRGDAWKVVDVDAL